MHETTGEVSVPSPVARHSPHLGVSPIDKNTSFKRASLRPLLHTVTSHESIVIAFPWEAAL
jgi:hypothetical protein